MGRHFGTDRRLRQEGAPGNECGNFIKHLSFPAAWYGLTVFLQGYAYRTEMHWWVFVAAGAITLVIALLTVGFKCVQAATANPVKSLRTE